MTAPRRLTETEKDEIRRLKTHGARTKELALKFSVHERTIERVVAGRPDRSKEYEKANAKAAKKLNPRKFWNAETVDAAQKKKPDYSLPKAGTNKARSAPKLPAPGKVVRNTEIIPTMTDYPVEKLPNGAVMRFSKDGTLAAVDGCAFFYGPRHGSIMRGTVHVEHIVDNDEEKTIYAIVYKWDGETIRGKLVFDGRVRWLIRNCYFYADELPEKFVKRDKAIRASFWGG